MNLSWSRKCSLSSAAENHQLYRSNPPRASSAHVTSPAPLEGSLPQKAQSDTTEIAALLNLLDNITSPLQPESDLEQSSAAKTVPSGLEDAQPVPPSDTGSEMVAIRDLSPVHIDDQ